MPEEVKQDVVVKEQDLVSRVAAHMEKPAESKAVKIEEDKFNTNDLQAEIDKISDPNLKAQFEGLRKSLQRGYNDKFQTIAEMRKELENQMTASNQWTPTRVQELLNDQNFVQAAQSVMQAQNPSNSGKTDEEWSTLTEGEKKQIIELRNEIALLKQQNMNASEKQQDEQLKGKYANYNAQRVAQLKSDLLSNKINATNEHLWKVVDYEDAIKRAYELGKTEKQELVNEKVNNFSYSPESANVVKEPKLSGEGEVTLTQLYNFNKQKQLDKQLRT